MDELERLRVTRQQLGLAPAMAMPGQPQAAPGRSTLTDGLAPATSRASAGRPYRSLFDGQVPWSNVPGKQAPLHAGPSSSTPASPATAAPTHGGKPSATDSKHTYRRQDEYDIKLGPIPAKVQIRFEASLKDRGSLRNGVPGKRGEITWGESQKLLERSAKDLDGKIKTSLMKANFDLLADGKLPGDLATLPLVPKVEIKGLEAGLSLKKGPELKLATLAFYVEGDLSRLLVEDTRSIAEIKGQIRIECALAPDLTKSLVDLGRAADAVKRSASVEAKIAKTVRWLSYYRARKGKDKVKQLEGELTKLKKVRAGVTEARDAALKKIEKIGLSLEKTAGGRLLKKVGGKALAVVFKKFIPIYNVISTAQDVYEVGQWLKHCDWGSIGDRIVNGGPGGTTFGDGSKDGEKSNGAGTGRAGAGDGGDVDADAIERELKQEANPELHATAQAVVGTVEKRSGDGGAGTQLSKEDKETLNLVIPWDLTPDEIDAMKAQLTTASSQPQDLVTSVIAALQQVRPLGQQRLGPSKTVVAASESRSTTNQESARTNRDDNAVAANDDRSTTNQDSARTNREDKASTSSTRVLDAKKADKTAHKQSSTRDLDATKVDKTANKQPGTWIVDPTETLRRVITADELGNVTVPAAVQFPGFMARVTRSGVARYSFGTGEKDSETSYMVEVTIRPIKPPTGMLLRDGRPIINDVDIKNVMVIVRAIRSSS